MSIEIRAAALLRGLDEHDAAASGEASGVGGLDGQESSRKGIAIVSRPSPEEQVAAAHRGERIETLGPVTERWLLVEVSVEQHRAARLRCGGGEVDDDGWSAAGDALHGDLRTGQVAACGPGGEKRNRGVDRRLPCALGGEVGRQAGNGDVALHEVDELDVDRRSN